MSVKNGDNSNGGLLSMLNMVTLNFFDSHHGWYCKIVEMPLMFHVTMRIKVSLGSTSVQGGRATTPQLIACWKRQFRSWPVIGQR